MNIESIKNASGLTELLELSRETYHYTDLTKKYYEAYFKNEFQLHELVVKEGEIPLALIFLTEREGELSYYGQPVRFIGQSRIIEKHGLDIVELLCKKFQGLRLRCFSGAHIEAPQDFKKIPYHHLKIDLQDQTEQEILRNCRKSYRSLINWGKRELETRILTYENFDEELFESFRKFHIQVAGRETRSQKTWDLQAEMIKANQAYLTLGFLEEGLVSGALCLHGTREAFYGVAVNNREMMAENKPLGHWIIISSVFHAKKIGLKSFVMDSYEEDNKTEKERAILKFKKGFVKEREEEEVLSFDLSL